jgi:hypothetical protein
MMRLILVRHGHVDGIYPPRLRGRCDVDLSELRLQQAYALKEIAAPFSDNRLPRPAADLPTLCLQHLRKLARQDPSTERDPGADRLLAALTHRLAPAAARAAEDMQRYVLKRDAFATVWQRGSKVLPRSALGFLAGGRAFPLQP